MPELPEVEQVKNSLKPYIIFKTIEDIDINVPRLVKSPTPELFVQGLVGKVIVDLERRGKYLIFHLSNKQMLVVHLRMTGALIYKPTQENAPDKPRIIFRLNEGVLCYCDTRTLGTLDLIDLIDLPKIKGLYSLGVEPISDSFTLEYLQDKMCKSKRLLKAFLLDQRMIAGLGNIYVDEAMAIAKLNPKKTTTTLNKKELKALHAAVKHVIAQGIANKGTTFRDYKDADGNKGNNQEHLLVYGRNGKACKGCGTTLVYEKIAGRGTVYCPHCQP